jgi:hypothetical protein
MGLGSLLGFLCIPRYLCEDVGVGNKHVGTYECRYLLSIDSP